ncbi:hypothetical protein QF012_005455, partial [Pseudomonas laurylsulfatiphila]
GPVRHYNFSSLPRCIEVHRPHRQRRRCLFIDRQRKPKGRPPSRHIDQLNLAPVQLQDAMHDPQPQPAIKPCAADIERAQLRVLDRVAPGYRG